MPKMTFKKWFKKWFSFTPLEVKPKKPASTGVVRKKETTKEWRKDTVWEKPKRTRTIKGRYKADDKSTPDVNEAWEGGKAPKKKKVKITRRKAKQK
tara:strand:+ start:1251 stop:1538 length:288 start_codon:yes stop_codon:yes gene_type:complete